MKKIIRKNAKWHRCRSGTNSMRRSSTHKSFTRSYWGAKNRCSSLSGFWGWAVSFARGNIYNRSFSGSPNR